MNINIVHNNYYWFNHSTTIPQAVHTRLVPSTLLVVLNVMTSRTRDSREETGHRSLKKQQHCLLLTRVMTLVAVFTV